MLILASASLVGAQTYTWTTNNGTITITECTGFIASGDVTIPSSINGLPVTSIGFDAFYYCSGPLLSVTIPDSVTSIGFGAFWECYSLTSVTIPDSVTSIGEGAFENCTHLTSVTIPDSVTSIGDEAFSGCSSLTTATIGNGVTSIGGGYEAGAFEGCTSLTNVTIGTNVTSIGEEAFYDCVRLTSISIPNSVTSIGEEAFYYCSGLASVTLGTSVTSLGESAFAYCPRLTSISIPASVTSIGACVFENCTSLTAVYFQGNAPSFVSYGFLFYGDNNVTVYYLPGTTGWANFAANTGLPTVLWNAQIQTGGASFGVRTNQFGFTITGASGLVIVVEACTNLANPCWYPLQTNTLTGSQAYFSDPQWTNHPCRFYGLGVP